MGHEIKQKQDTAITWKPSGGTYALTLTSLGTGGGQKGVVHDWGAVFPINVRFFFKTKFAVAPTAGGPVTIYWCSSDDNSDFDAAFSSGDAAVTDEQEMHQLHYVGTLGADNDTNAQAQSWVFALPARYGFVVVWNASGQALSATAADHEVRAVPLLDEIQ